VVRENLETLYVAVDAGEGTTLPAFVKKELEGYLDCGILAKGFAHLKCESCGEHRLVAWSCKGRGFCPSCLGRRMSSTAANLIDHTLPKTPLRQWVLTFPFELRHRLAYDSALLGRVTRIFVDTVFAFYLGKLGASGKGGALTVVQRCSSDLRLNPHLHTVALDGVFVEEDKDALAFRALAHLKTEEVKDVLSATVRRIVKHLVRRGVLTQDSEVTCDEAFAERESALFALTASAVSGAAPCGPEIKRDQLPIALRLSAAEITGPLCARESGFTLHAATRAGAEDERGREALLSYVLRPPVSQTRITEGPDGLVRITLKKPFSDGTTAIDLDPLSLISRLAAMVPFPYFNTTRYQGVLASHHSWRSRIVPKPALAQTTCEHEAKGKKTASTYRPWAELLSRTFALDVEQCPSCNGRMKIVSLVKERRAIVRFLHHLGEPTDPPERSPARDPPYWKSRVLRRKGMRFAA